MKRRVFARVIAGVIFALLGSLFSTNISYADSNEIGIYISGPDADGITNVGLCLTNPSQAIGTWVSYGGSGSGGFLVHSGTPACPTWAAGGGGYRLESGKTYEYLFTAIIKGVTYTASRTYVAPGEDPAVVAARNLRVAHLANVVALKALAESVAQKAADQTPGIVRCSKWTGYGETGQECAYTFIVPTGSTPTGSTPSDTSTVSTSISDISTVQLSASSDPFPNLTNGSEIPGTRITSAAGVSQVSWESTSTYKNFQCPAGSGRATGVDMNFTISQSDDKWFAYCVKSWRLSSSSDSDTKTVSSSNSNGSTGLSSQSDTATSSSSSSSKSGSSTATSTSGSPSVEASVVAVSGTAAEIKDLISKIVTTKSEVTALNTVLTKVDVVTKINFKSFRLPVSRVLDEVATSLTPEICTTNGSTVSSIKKGTCLLNYTLTGDSGNSFTIQKTIVFKK